MAKAITPDICVIGAGPGGLAVAAGAAAYGVKVIVVDRLTPAGNLARGALPASSFAAAARRAQAMRDAGAFGLPSTDPDIDFKEVMARIRKVVSDAAVAVAAERLATLGITVIDAEARFVGRRRLHAGEKEIRARRYVLATGAVPVVPSIAGLEEAGFLTPDSVFDLDRRPEHLIVLGGDAEGLELAQAFRRLGSQVTVLADGGILPAEDPEMAAVIVRGLRAEGIVIREGVKATAVEKHGEAGIRVLTDGEGDAGRIDGDRLLLALGRKPDVAGLDLKKAHVVLKEDAVDVSAMLRTTNRRIYAIGDVTGTRSAQAARRQADMVLRALLFRLPAKDHAHIPRVVATDPGLAHVGMTEAEALHRHRRLTILRWPFAENDRARAEGSTQGHIKLLVARNGEVLGATIAGAGAADLIGMWSLAVSKRLGLKELASSIPPHPTIAEIGKSVAISYFAGKARGRLVRGWVRLLQFFG